MVESENIDEYNLKFGLNIPYLDFRRNIITKGIKLNDLVGKKLSIGNVEVEGIDLCRPCRHLTEMLDQENILKEFLRKGGLRCQILSSSQIKVGDSIKVLSD
jgi:MOSC domain-containing protein YiiM